MSSVHRCFGTYVQTESKDKEISLESIRDIVEAKRQRNQGAIVIHDTGDDVAEIADLARSLLGESASVRNVKRAGRDVIIAVSRKEDLRESVERTLTSKDYSSAAKVVRSLDLPKSTIEDVLQKVHSAIQKSDVATEQRRAFVPGWKYRSGMDSELTPPEFIRKYYGDLIENRTLTQAFVRKVDKSLYWAFHNWRRSASGRNVELDFEFPPANRVGGASSELNRGESL